MPAYNPLIDALSYFHNDVMANAIHVFYYVCGGEESELNLNNEEEKETSKLPT